MNLRLRLSIMVLITTTLLLPATGTRAHTMAPVLITIAQLNATEYRVLWSFSQGEGAVEPTSLSLSFRPSCKLDRPGVLTAADNRWLREERYKCGSERSESLDVQISGLALAETSAALRLVDAEGNEQIHLLDEDAGAINLSRERASQNIFLHYMLLGGQHILEGADHVLFVVALCFLAGGRVRTLIGLISAFTVAHSITLLAAALSWIKLPERPVEALIALSIALVAADLVRNPGVSHRQLIVHWPVVFIFGLLHGLGFAGALLELGVRESALMASLLSFNLGVEFGQLGIVLVCALLIQLTVKLRKPNDLNLVVGLGIGCTAGFWFVSRIV